MPPSYRLALDFPLLRVRFADAPRSFVEKACRILALPTGGTNAGETIKPESEKTVDKAGRPFRKL
jgi:hypothetical protein